MIIHVLRKPLDNTVAANVLAHGTGALNIDGCRIASADGYADNAVAQGVNTARTSWEPRREQRTFVPSQSGRWPSNILLDDAAAALVDGQRPSAGGGFSVSGGNPLGHGIYNSGFPRGDGRVVGYGDSGGASRFFQRYVRHE